jgi:hypothetical protein
VRLPDLPADSATAFEDFHSFLYTGKVYTVIEDEENAADMDKEWPRLANAWILGEVLLSTSFKDAALDALVHKLASGNVHSTDTFFAAYRYGSESSAIRRLVLDIAVYWWSESNQLLVDTCIFGDPEILAPFFRSLCMALLKERRQPASANKTRNPTKQETCFYHEHGDKPCYKTMF